MRIRRANVRTMNTAVKRYVGGIGKRKCMRQSGKKSCRSHAIESLSRFLGQPFVRGLSENTLKGRVSSFKVRRGIALASRNRFIRQYAKHISDMQQNCYHFSPRSILNFYYQVHKARSSEPRMQVVPLKSEGETPSIVFRYLTDSRPRFQGITQK